jgi:hypothetical protein
MSLILFFLYKLDNPVRDYTRRTPGNLYNLYTARDFLLKTIKLSGVDGPFFLYTNARFPLHQDQQLTGGPEALAGRREGSRKAATAGEFLGRARAGASISSVEAVFLPNCLISD